MVTSFTSYLIGTLATERIAVGVFDRSLHVSVSNNGVWHGKLVGEAATPVYKLMEKHSYCKENIDISSKLEMLVPSVGNKPVIDEKVIIVSTQGLPHIGQGLVLLVQTDVLRQPLRQHGAQPLSLRPLVANDHVDHISQALILKPLAQAVHSTQIEKIREHKVKIKYYWVYIY